MKFCTLIAPRLYQMALSLDQSFGCFIGLFIGGGWADETFSARCWREGNAQMVGGIVRPGDERWNAVRIAVDALFFWDKQHCFASYVSEFERKQLPEEYRK